MHTVDSKKILLLSPYEISVDRDIARKSVDGYELHSLAASLRSNGIIEPLCVRKDGKDKFILISGYRRLQAARIAGMRRVPCVLHRLDERQAALFSLVSNLNRENLDCFTQAEAIDRLIGAYKIDLCEISQKLGIGGAAVERKLSLLKIPKELRGIILSANLSEAHAALIASLDKKDMPIVLEAVISENLSLKQTKELLSSPGVSNEQKGPEPEFEKAQPIRKSAIGDVKMFSNSLAKLLLTMQNSGIKTNLVRKETNGFIEYRIKIENRPEKQLSFSGI